MESFENVLSVVSGQTLMELTLPPQDYVIRGLLPMGLSIIGGAPKIGKSWLMLDLCVKVAKGEPLWEMETKRGTTLYEGRFPCHRHRGRMESGTGNQGKPDAGQFQSQCQDAHPRQKGKP